MLLVGRWLRFWLWLWLWLKLGLEVGLWLTVGFWIWQRPVFDDATQWATGIECSSHSAWRLIKVIPIVIVIAVHVTNISRVDLLCLVATPTYGGRRCLQWHVGVPAIEFGVGVCGGSTRLRVKLLSN